MDQNIYFACISTFKTVQYKLNSTMRIATLEQIKVLCDGSEVPIVNLDTLNSDVDHGVITLGEKLDLSKVYTLVIDGCPPKTLVPTKVFDCNEFITNYTYDGDRGMVVDLGSTDPENWDKDTVVTLDKYTDAVIWEIHVRDFSNKLTASNYKGKYLAFTERGLTNASGVSVGVDYLLQLGVTHLHLLPAFDYASVDESKPSFNWGYDCS